MGDLTDNGALRRFHYAKTHPLPVLWSFVLSRSPVQKSQSLPRSGLPAEAEVRVTQAMV